MVYIVSYICTYNDDYDDHELLGVFSDEDSAYKCAIQKYCEVIQEHILNTGEESLKATLEEKLFGSPRKVYRSLGPWRDELFNPPFQVDIQAGPIVFVESKETLEDWDLDAFLKKEELNVGGKTQEIIDELTSTKSGKIESKAMKELLSRLEEDLSFEYVEKIVERADLTSSANEMWKDYLKKLERRVLEAQLDLVNVEFNDGNFQVMKYQVTQDLWERVMGSNPSHFRGASRPVEMVSWLDSVVFANKLSEKEGLEKVYEIPEGMEEGCKNQTSSYDEVLDEYAQSVKVNKEANGYRLPTEAEWEYAAKGGEQYKQAGSDDLKEIAWYENNSRGETHGVGQKKANGYGLYDMSGNVWEWCFNMNSRYGVCIVRGGDFQTNGNHYLVFYRNYGKPSCRYSGFGVRFFRPAPQDS